MITWTIYRHPKDFPDKYVLRKFFYALPTGDKYLADTLEDIRKHVPNGLVRIPRDKDDDQPIVETWI